MSQLQRPIRSAFRSFRSAVRTNFKSEIQYARFIYFYIIILVFLCGPIIESQIQRSAAAGVV